MHELNTVDGVIRYIESNSGIKLKWYQKLWLKFTSWADYRLERIVKLR